MARSLCTCGATILWKADEPESDEWLMFAKRDTPDDFNDVEWMLRATTDAAFCANCGRLWVAWEGSDAPAEYVPADPNVRPMRPHP